MSVCMKCGTNLEPGARVCTNCGTPIRPSMQSAGQVKRSQSAGAPTPKKSGRNPGVIIAIILAAAIAVGAGVIITARNRNAAPAETETTTTVSGLSMPG